MDAVMVLKMIQRGYRHEYAVTDFLNISGGTVNAIFHKLTEAGLIEAMPQQGIIKYWPQKPYVLTRNGHEALECVDYIEARRTKYPSSEELESKFGSDLINRMHLAGLLEELDYLVKVPKLDDPSQGAYLPVFDLGRVGKCIYCGHDFQVGNGMWVDCPRCGMGYTNVRKSPTLLMVLGVFGIIVWVGVIMKLPLFLFGFLTLAVCPLIPVILYYFGGMLSLEQSRFMPLIYRRGAEERLWMSIEERLRRARINRIRKDKEEDTPPIYRKRRR